MMTQPELEAQRQQLIERLTDCYANDQLELEDFEELVERAEAATDRAALDKLLEGLPGAEDAEGEAETALAPVSAQTLEPATRTATTSTALVPTEDVPENRTLVTILSGVKRNKRWTVPRRLKVYSVLGGTDLDLREARLAPGVTEIKVVSLLAGVKVLVPPDLPVEIDGTGILGSFEDKGHGDDIDASTGDEAPCRLRIRGLAVLSGVEVEQRLAGESKRQAKKRRKRERKALATASADRLLAGRRNTSATDAELVDD